MTFPGEGFSQGEEERPGRAERERERESDPPEGREEEGDHVAILEESIGSVVRGETDKLIIFLSYICPFQLQKSKVRAEVQSTPRFQSGIVGPVED